MRKKGMKNLDSFEKAAAFRETFLFEKPDGEKEIYRHFGQALYNIPVGLRQSPHEAIKRGSLRAALADLEHLEEFLEDTFSGGRTGEYAEARLDEAAVVGRERIREVVAGIRTALGMKLRDETVHDVQTG
jgi:hypothetical protein